VHVGLWNYIWQPGRDELISIVNVCSFRSYTDIIHTITVSPDEQPLAIEILLSSMLESMHESLFNSLDE
jgi:hypothetical protein